MFYAFGAGFKRSEITRLEAFEKQKLKDGRDESGWGAKHRADSDIWVFKKHFLILSCASLSVSLLLLLCGLSLGQPKVVCEKRRGVGHSFTFESAVSCVSESKKNTKKTVALVISTLRQSAKQNLQQKPQHICIRNISYLCNACFELLKQLFDAASFYRLNM